MRVVQGLRGDLTWATTILESALESGDASVAAHGRVQQAFLRLFMDPEVIADELLAVATDAISVFKSLEDDVGLARSWRLAAQAHYLARRAAGCVEASEHALVHARRAGDVFETREVVERLAVALALGPTRATEAERRCRELLEAFAGDRFLEGDDPCVGRDLVALQGRSEDEEPLIAEARRTVDDPGGAEADLRAALRTLDELGERTNYTSVAAELALVACANGDYAEAEALSAKSEATARPNDVLANSCGRVRVPSHGSRSAIARRPRHWPMTPLPSPRRVTSSRGTRWRARARSRGRAPHAQTRLSATRLLG